MRLCGVRRARRIRGAEVSVRDDISMSKAQKRTNNSPRRGDGGGGSGSARDAFTDRHYEFRVFRPCTRLYSGCVSLMNT